MRVKVHLKNIDADPNEIKEKILDLDPNFQFQIKDTYTFIIPVDKNPAVEIIQAYFKDKGKTVLITREEPIV